jgi:hypothetical protein
MPIIRKTGIDHADYCSLPITPRASIFTYETHGQEEPAMHIAKLAIVIGSIRPDRFGGHAAQPDYLAVIKGGKPLNLEHLNRAARQMVDQLAWWTAALKAAREKILHQVA